MNWLLRNPFRVYLIVIGLALVGLLAGLELPISLYPNSSKPTIYVDIPYGRLNAQEFLDTYGETIDAGLKSLSSGETKVEKTISEYSNSNVNYQVEFEWGVDNDAAKKEVESYINSLSSRWPKEIRDGAKVNSWSRSSGFVAISYFSESRGLDELYDILEPELIPKLANLPDSERASLWNPGKKEVRIELDNMAMTTLGLTPFHLERALDLATQGQAGGSLKVGTNTLIIETPRLVENLDSLKKLLIDIPGGGSVLFRELAKITIGESSESGQFFKTNGTKSLILFANPKIGGNIKRLAEDILGIVEETAKKLPQDIRYRVLVDPSEFIKASVNNVIHEVIMAAGLAVLVLFLFVGSIRNTVTAAIEIPLSMVLAFLLMKLFGMNLNLISLGGLALSAGMNVDASVVVMENILRNFKNSPGHLDFEGRFQLVLNSLKEVRLSIVASTLSTLVVFLPMVLTSDLTNAILGDLGKAVVFSHFFAMIIALFVVPVVRLQMIQSFKSKDSLPKAPLEKWLVRLEDLYAYALDKIIEKKKIMIVPGLVFLSLSLFVFISVVPNLKREVIGTPDTDWMILSVSTSGNTMVKQMEALSDENENRLLEKFGEYLKYTFTQIRKPNQSTIMARLKDKSEMEKVWKLMEKEFTNSPTVFYWVGPWNPAELPLPNPPHMKLVIRGGKNEDRMEVAREVHRMAKAEDVFPRIWSSPDTRQLEVVKFLPNRFFLGDSKKDLSVSEITDLTKVLTTGKSLSEISLEGKSYPVFLTYKETIQSLEDLEAFPVNRGQEIVALKTLGTLEREYAKPLHYREDGRELVVVSGKQKKGDESKIAESLIQMKKVLNKFEKVNRQELDLDTEPSLSLVDARVELNKAIKQLVTALLISILLIFLTLIFQFGKISHSLVIMTAIPLGTVGGILSLWLFDSSMSLNAFLGIILLNGIAVNNSIILVDFILEKIKLGLTKKAAILIACKMRLRPILITSLTTILGMTPIALGLGEGGKILRPLGLAVTGGLWFSMFFTLFLVPFFESILLNDKSLKKPKERSYNTLSHTRELEGNSKLRPQEQWQ